VIKLVIKVYIGGDMTENGSVHFNEKESKYKGFNNRHNF
jgi:hypothetical protein